jgi:hypothetical protein
MTYAPKIRLTRFRAPLIVGRQFLFRNSNTERQDHLPELNTVNDSDYLEPRLTVGNGGTKARVGQLLAD